MFASFFNSIITALKNLVSFFPDVIEWLNEPLRLGFDAGFLGFIGINLGSPLSLIGVGVLVLLGLWAVKSLVPLL